MVPRVSSPSSGALLLADAANSTAALRALAARAAAARITSRVDGGGVWTAAVELAGGGRARSQIVALDCRPFALSQIHFHIRCLYV